ncbi:MAG: hypothetical protein JNL97_15950, partial [Verrucomicrobiales bacterium]|nr:hypothetical protein [Verrucomicrobiales bacterium]
MPWNEFEQAGPSVSLLRRSLRRDRLGHAYLFSGDSTDTLTGVAGELAAAVNCVSPVERTDSGLPAEACGE